ncbi:MAG: hypothetical protein WBK51_06510 [Polaromonas sp.]
MTTLALDFGDQFLELASADQGVVSIVKDPVRGTPLRLPACVAVEDGVAWLGHAAIDRVSEMPRVKVLGGIKRSLGQVDPVLEDTTGRHWQAEGLAGLLIKKALEDFLLSHPASTLSAVVALAPDVGEAGARALRAACRLAGFSAVVTVDQAVAHASSLNLQIDESVLVADAGSGPVSVSLVTRRENGYTIDAQMSGDMPLRNLILQVMPPGLCALLRPIDDDVAYELSVAEILRDTIWAKFGAEPARSWSGWIPDNTRHASAIPVAFSAQVVDALAKTAAQEIASLVRQVLAKSGAAAVTGCSLTGGWGRNVLVTQHLARENLIGLRFSLAPVAAIAFGAARWHAQGFSPLRDVSSAMIGIRTVNPDSGQPMIHPLIAAGTALPATGVFPLFANRLNQKRLVIEIAKVDDDGQDWSLGFFAFDFEKPLSMETQLEVTVSLGREMSVAAQACDHRTSKRVEAVLGSDDIDSVEAFWRQHQWIRGLGLNDARFQS